MTQAKGKERMTRDIRKMKGRKEKEGEREREKGGI